jgi:hypothetical protein
MRSVLVGWLLLSILQASAQEREAGQLALPASPSPLSGLQNSPVPPALAESKAASPPAMEYNPGEGLTVRLLNDSSRLKLFAQFSALGIASTDRPLSAGLPLLLLPGSPFGLSTNTFDLHGRQTAFGAMFEGPEINGLTPGAFFLGFIQNDNLLNDAYGFLPYQAYGELKNEQWRFAAGLQSDVFNPGKPTVITLGSLFGSGNTGSFRGQARVERTFKPNEEWQFTTQVALSEAISSIVAGNQRLIEDNGVPNLEARLETGLGRVEERAGGRKLRTLEIGLSGVIGQIRTSRTLLSPADPETANRAVVNTRGVGLDLQWVLTHRLGFAGELFLGQGLGEYNGGILQSFNATTFRPIRSRGGWGETYFYLSDEVHVHVGYGIDAPLQQDLAPTQFARNQTAYVNLVWDVSKSLQWSLEVDYRKTQYLALRNAEGVVVLTQMLWRF